MSALKPDEKMFKHQYVLQGWNRKCLPQDEYWQFQKAIPRNWAKDPFICNCGQYCLFD